jgi:hypothetical protein
MLPGSASIQGLLSIGCPHGASGRHIKYERALVVVCPILLLFAHHCGIPAERVRLSDYRRPLVLGERIVGLFGKFSIHHCLISWIVASSIAHIRSGSLRLPACSPLPTRAIKSPAQMRGLFANCSRWYRATSRRTLRSRFRSMWSDRLDCHSDCRSSDARRLAAQHPDTWDRFWRSTHDEPCAQRRTCPRARTQRLMLLS